MLHSERWGAGDPLVLIHGFTQSSGSWGAIGTALGARHAVIAVDAPGHGRSADVVADLATGADLMAVAAVDEMAAIEEMAGTRKMAGTDGAAAWLGYSMGGRYALHVALRHPGRVSRLVVVSATGGIDDPSDRAARRDADEAIAGRAETDGVAAFVEWWLLRPLFATLPRDAAAIDSRMAGSATGLASSLRTAGTGTQQPLWSELHQLGMPVLVVAGALDPAYLTHSRRLVASIGANASLAVIDGAGHACHLEATGAFLEVVLPFLDGH